MKLTLLGTGADECIPAFGCGCSTCTYSRAHGGRNIRQNSSMIIEDGTDSILIDMPPQTMAQLRTNTILENGIRAILFTHRHDDHTAGARYLYQRRPQKGFQKMNQISVYLPASAFRHLENKHVKYDDHGKPRDIESTTFNIVQSYDRFILDSLQITALETNHLKMKHSPDECFGYLFEAENGASFAYLLDAGSDIPARTKEILRDIKLSLLITDCTFSRSDNPGHMDIDRLQSLQKYIAPQRTIISHIGHRNQPHDMLLEHFKGTGVDVGFDGMTIDL